MRQLFALVLGLAGIVVSPAAQAQSNDLPCELPACGLPRIWCWNAPQGEAACDPRFARHTLVDISTDCGPRDPYVLGMQTAAQLAGRAGEEITILLKNFGAGTPNVRYGPEPCELPLMFHAADAIQSPTRPRMDPYWETPWTAHGLPVARVWVEGFIAGYKQAQAVDPLIPDPARFLFDSEIVPSWTLNGLKGCADDPNDLCAQDSECADTGDLCRTWATMRVDLINDPRWGDPNDPEVGEKLIGFDRTLAVLWKEAGFPGLRCPDNPELDCIHDPTVHWKLLPEFTNWYASIVYRVTQAAMHEAAFSLIEDPLLGWPGCRAGEFEASGSYGVATAPDAPFASYPLLQPASIFGTGVYGCSDNSDVWINIETSGPSGLACPVLFYLAPWQWDDAVSCTRDDETLNMYRHLLEAQQYTGSGYSGDRIVPWIWLLGERTATSDGWIISAELQRRQLALLRAKGIQEMYVYNDAGQQSSQTPLHWTKLCRMLDDIWCVELQSVTVVAASASKLELEQVVRSDRSFARVASASGALQRTSVEFLFATHFDEPAALTVNYELRLSAEPGGSVPVSLDAYDWSRRIWTNLGSNALIAGSDVQIASARLGWLTANYVKGDGKVRLRLRSESALAHAIEYDLVQLIADE